MTGEVIRLPYGKSSVQACFPTPIHVNNLQTQASKEPSLSGSGLVREALRMPIAGKRLCELAQGKKRVVIISSDHTRPVPSRILMPELLREIRQGNPLAEIVILVATGCHRAPTHEELLEKYGAEIVARETICIHDCDAEDLVDLGDLPSGNRLWLNNVAAHADLLIAEGFIEPHFFAGFSGGRKSVLPGICGRKTILRNHCAANIAHVRSVSGMLEGNPVHMDMLCAAKAAKLAFILNVVLGENGKIIGAFAGAPEETHQAGVAFAKTVFGCCAPLADIVVTSNGGYPLDQNIYQSVKGMSTAKQLCKKGGVIIMVAQCGDGHGGKEFFETFANDIPVEQIYRQILSRSPNQTKPDQWQSQIFAEVLQWATVILVSDAPKSMVEAMRMTWAGSLQQAIDLALQISNQKHPEVTCLPDAVSAIVCEQNYSQH